MNFDFPQIVSSLRRKKIPLLKFEIFFSENLFEYLCFFLSLLAANIQRAF